MSNIIDSIQLSGTVYTISGGGGSPTVELTQAEYDALVTAGTVSANTYYIITDASAGDLTQYWTSAQTQAAITSAVSTKQDTLVSGTNIKTINNESILGSGNIDIQGGGVDVVQTTGTSTTDVMSQDAVTTQLNGTVKLSNVGTYFINNLKSYTNSLEIVFHRFDVNNTVIGSRIWYGKINNKYTCGFGNPAPSDLMNLSVVETSAITTSISSSSTDAQVPSAKAVYDAIQEGGGGSSYTAGDGIDITNDVISVTGKVDTSTYNTYTAATNTALASKADTATTYTKTEVDTALSGYVTTDTLQDITAQKTFVGDPTNKEKSIKFKQYDDASKVGFVIKNTADTNNELATFEFRPNTFTIDGVQHPLLYFGHYRNTNTANAGVPQTVIGFRQYDQKNAAAYHYLIPLPEKAKTPFSLTTSFKDYYAPIGFKNGSTMITTDNTGVADFSDVLGGLKLVKLSQSEYDSLATKDNSTLYVIVN